MVDINEILKKYETEEGKENEKAVEAHDNISQVKVDMADIPISREDKTPEIKVEEKREKRRKKKRSKLINLEEEFAEKEEELSGGGEPEDEALQEILIETIAIPFEIWHMRNPRVSPLSEEEKAVIKKPLTRVIKKYGLDEYASDEIILAVVLGGLYLRE